jgi:hypothetical protein
MSAPFSSLLLDLDNNDLCLDALGNIAVCTAPYAVAQDVACAIKTFLGDVFYDTTQGIPYLTKILGKTPPLSYFKEQIVNAALTVPTVVSAVCVITALKNRQVTGYVSFTDAAGVERRVTL